MICAKARWTHWILFMQLLLLPLLLLIQIWLWICINGAYQIHKKTISHKIHYFRIQSMNIDSSQPTNIQTESKIHIQFQLLQRKFHNKRIPFYAKTYHWCPFLFIFHSLSGQNLVYHLNMERFVAVAVAAVVVRNAQSLKNEYVEHIERVCLCLRWPWAVGHIFNQPETIWGW